MSTATVKTKQREKLNTLPVMTFNLGRLHQRLTDKDFEKICAQNPDYRIEMTKEGQLIVMMPVGLEGSHRNHKLAARFGSWAESNNLGVAFDASGGLTLPNGAKRSPDAFWIRKDRWEKLSAEERSTFGHICPDFVVELRSKSDRLKPLQNKMSE